MKRKILSFFMATILLFITVSVGFVVNSASQNLISNGDFKEYSNNIPANWNVSLKSNTTAQVVENVSIADGITANAVKFTTTATNSQRSEFYYTGKVKIERNTTYTTTFWVKSDSIAGFKAYMYEPTYTDTSGNQKTSNIAVEGQNIYTYTYDNGSTRVIRTDIAHSWTIAQTGAVIDKTSTASMFIYRYNGTNLFPSTDYPNQTKAGEWVQIMHTFKTGDDTAHIAEVSYDFAIPEAVDGEFWIANVVMTAQSDNVETPEASITDSLEDYANGTLLAQITHTKNISATDTDWTETSYLNTANDGKGVYYIESSYGGTFRKATVTTDAARTGKNSILLNAPYGYLGRKFTGLEKNTQYTISFYAKSASASQFGNLTITTPNMTIYNTNGTIKANTEFIARNTALYTASDVWSEATITFNSGDNTEVILWINHLSRTTLYLDDFAVYEYIMATVNAERGGDVKLNYDPEKIPVGANVTVEATPYSGNTFICWRDETGKLVSTSPKYTFTANTNFTLTALFDGNNMPEFDAFSIEDYDGTFENGTIGNWYFEDTISGYASYWCSAVRTTDNAYEGDYSITLRSRYRDAVLPINVYAHTNYTLSFYIKFAATDDDASISYAAVLPYNKANPHSTNKIFATADITPSNEWQKVEFNFNSESCTNLKFILRYTTNSLNNADYVYLDNISLVCKDYTGPQRTEFFTPGNIDGDDADNANLLDLITLAQYVANWENISVDTKALDVNGDSLVDLEDVLTLSRVLAGWNSVKLSTSPYISYPN